MSAVTELFEVFVNNGTNLFTASARISNPLSSETSSVNFKLSSSTSKHSRFAGFFVHDLPYSSLRQSLRGHLRCG